MKRLLPASLMLALGLSATAASSAHADAPGSFAAAMGGITSADGTVRTQAGVKLVLHGSEGMHARQLESVRSSLSTQMVSVRSCFAQAMSRSPIVEGTVVVELTAQKSGRAQAKLKRSSSNDSTMTECMRAALSTAQLKHVSHGTKVEAWLEVDNPVAKLRAKQAQRSTLADVRMLSGGQAESSGGTAGNEVGYRVAGSAYASETIGALNQQLLTNLPGLLDCRRKSSRKTRTAEGSLSFDVAIEDGRIQQHPTGNTMNDRRAPACISAWLQRIDASRLASAKLDLTVSFSR